MLDFMRVSTRTAKRGTTIEIYPKFLLVKTSDLMIRGGDFYAVWVEDRQLWSTDEFDALQLIDRELDQYAEENRQSFGNMDMRVLHMWDSENGMIAKWHMYCQRHSRDNFHMLDERIIFSNTETKKTDYASKRLAYPLEAGECPAWEKLISTLYSEEERRKIEWAIGSIVSGESRTLQKFVVLYGSAGTGKSTVLNIIQQLFDGYYCTFSSKALGSASASFALEVFRTNPLVAIEHDGDLSRIDDNTRLNSLVSHEEMTVNEKFKSSYTNRFKCFLFIGTNKPVKITDAKSGLLRRLIDISPSGDKLDHNEYNRALKQISFELGAIASHCMDVYQANKHLYDDYIPSAMLGATNDFYNFVLEQYDIFKRDDSVSLKIAWEMYKTYCDEAKVLYPFSKRLFKEEMKNYFRDYRDRYGNANGDRMRNCYVGFKSEKFEDDILIIEAPKALQTWLVFDEQPSIFDEVGADYISQYATEEGRPFKSWSKVSTKLSSLDTSKVHYVRVPENHIVIDFDIPDDRGNKSFDRNFEEASKWPATYAELSKSGGGIHLHYIYTGDVTRLSPIYADHIEVKTFTGKSSLRRKLSRCNNLPIANISSGLPLKGDKKLVNEKTVKSERGLRDLIKRNLRKEFMPGTKPSMDFIKKDLDAAYDSGLEYDVSDMKPLIFSFAANSTNQSEYCISLINQMKFKSQIQTDNVETRETPIVFYDVEVFPNLVIVNWKFAGEGKMVQRIINPKPSDIEELLQYRLIGFNNNRYDDHILYALILGWSNDEIFDLSQRMINGKDERARFNEAYKLAYSDIWSFASNKQGLKKWEIELGIHHQELGLPWDQPVPVELWETVAEYCDNDVLATEAVFNCEEIQSDWLARQVAAALTGMTVNDSTNRLSTRFILGNEKHPQDQFNYRNMNPSVSDGYLHWDEKYDEYSLFDSEGRPYFPGYIFESGKSTYRGEEVGEGGYVYSEPGMHGNVALLDIASMHPSSIIAENLFGDMYTARFKELVDARLAIKHKDFDTARKMFGGKLTPFLEDESKAGNLAKALKIMINSVYGLTAARFANPFRDPRNKDNIVAKRGALFMVNLKHEVQKRGFTVAHIKTDSIKIPDATPEIISFVTEYGKMYGYTFEHEGTYERMTLVNDAVYIAKYATVEQCERLYGRDYVYSSGDVVKENKKHSNKWTATGTQFAVPYVFKTLFSKEPIIFSDKCETKSVQKGALYLDMNEDLRNVTAEEKELEKLEKKFREGKISDITFEETSASLREIIAQGHSYHFVGRVGQFCPVIDGVHGGVLYREQNGKYYAVSGTKGWRWLESEVIRNTGMEDKIDELYYHMLVDDAVQAINLYGDFTWFVSNEPYIGPSFEKGEFMNKPVYDEELPWC